MRGRLISSLVIIAAGTLAACTDQHPSEPPPATGTDPLLGRGPGACQLSAEQQALIDDIRSDVDLLFLDPGGTTPAGRHIDNIERKLCQEQFDDALGMAWEFLGLVEEKMPDQFGGDSGDAAELTSAVFALVAAEPNPAESTFEIPPGAFDETGGVITFDPADASPESPIVASTQNREAAVVVDAPNAFPPGSGPVTIVLSRAPTGVVATPGAFIPGFQAFEEGYEILSSAQPSAIGPGVLIALCVVPPIPEDVDPVIGHLHEESVSLLVPTDPDPQTLEYIDCSDVEPFPGGGVEAVGHGSAGEEGGGASNEGQARSRWTDFARRLAEPVHRWLTPAALNAEEPDGNLLGMAGPGLGVAGPGLGVAGPGLGGRTRSLSLNAPVDPTIDVGETAQLSVGTDATWSSDDTGVATVDGSGLVTGVSAGTATITATFTDVTGATEVLSMEVTVEGGVVGGSLIAFASGRDGDVEIYVMSLDGSGQTNITNAPASTDNAPTWSPDGTRIAFVSNVSDVDRIYTMGPDGSNVVGPLGTGAFTAWPDWSPDGTMIVYSDGGRVHIMNADGTGDFTLPVPVPGVVDWSPDGSQFVVDSGGDILVLSSDGTGTQTVLTTGSLLDTGPRWSPDGTKVAFSREDPGVTNPDIYVMNADGTNLVNLTSDPAFDNQPSWSPDGSQIYFWSNRTGPALVHVMNADGTNPMALTSAGPDFDPERQPVESPLE